MVSRKILDNLGCSKEYNVQGLATAMSVVKPPLVPFWCSFPALCLLMGCIGRCWSWAGFCAVPHLVSPPAVVRGMMQGHLLSPPPVLSLFWCGSCFHCSVWQGQCWMQCKKVGRAQAGSVLSSCELSWAGNAVCGQPGQSCLNLSSLGSAYELGVHGG